MVEPDLNSEPESRCMCMWDLAHWIPYKEQHISFKAANLIPFFDITDYLSSTNCARFMEWCRIIRWVHVSLWKLSYHPKTFEGDEDISCFECSNKLEGVSVLSLFRLAFGINWHSLKFPLAQVVRSSKKAS